MFFIANQENYIIAADIDFLKDIGAANIFEAASLMKNGDIQIDELELSISYLHKNYTYSKIPLSSFLGDSYLYEVTEEISGYTDNQEDDLINLAIPSTRSSIDDVLDPKIDLQADITSDREEIPNLIDEEFKPDIYNDEIIPLADEEDIEILDRDYKSAYTEAALGTAASAAGINKLLNTDAELDKSDTQKSDEIISIKDEKEKTISFKESTFEIEEPSIDIETSQEEIDDELSIISDENTQSTQPAISINTKEIASLIGISEEEYIHFIGSFYNESHDLESDLRSNDLMKSKEAISVLKETSLLLHLPIIAEKLNQLSNTTSSEKETLVDEFLGLVSQITNSKNYASTGNSDIVRELEEESIPSIESTSQRKDISLSDIEVIPFDFSISNASDELVLPASLVSEFVIDFIKQAKENIPILNRAYKDKDLETLQKTAHTLKGASSNLRIIPMADTLHNLQMNSNLEEAPEIINLFLGQLKALSIQMNQE